MPGSLPAIETLFEEAPCGLMLARADGAIVMANTTICRWLGFPCEQLVGQRRMQDLLTVGGRVFHQTHWVPLLQMQGSVAEVKLDIRHADGQLLPMLLNAIRRPHDGGVFDEISFVVLKDRNLYERELLATRAKLAELNGRLSEADRRKDEFLATLAHELRNPLAPMRNVLQVLLQKDMPDPRMTWARDIMDRQVRHMTRLVDDLMEISRITQGKLRLRRERLDLTVAMQTAVDAVQPLMQASGHELTLTYPAAPIILLADATRLTQVILNLLNNAAKYTPRGGKVWLGAERQGGEAVITVRDSGIGIPAQHIPRLFEMFSQVEAARDRSQGGLGIGLALVRGLVELHGGKVTAASGGAEQGSEFTVRLPIQHVPESAADGPPAAPPPSPRRILVVEDNSDAAQSLGLLLEMEGHQVRLAYAGEQALEQGADFYPDIVILDIGLPDFDGYEAARRIRREPWGARVLLVALTGWGQEQDRQAATDAGFDRHLTKPLEPQQLEELLRHAPT
jgi:PAS domain S-box-containing protein